MSKKNTPKQNAAPVEMAVCDFHDEPRETFERVLRERGGIQTPAEELIYDLVMQYRWLNGSITPDHVDKLAAEFKVNFDDLIEEARRTLGLYPEFVAGPEDSAEEAEADMAREAA
jgi:hypothetical protein